MYNERSQVVHGNYLNGFEKILIWGEWTTLGQKMARPHITLDPCERRLEVHENYINSFAKRNITLCKRAIFGPKIV